MSIFSKKQKLVKLGIGSFIHEMPCHKCGTMLVVKVHVSKGVGRFNNSLNCPSCSALFKVTQIERQDKFDVASEVKIKK